MAANAAEFAGPGCGRRYEKELETHFRDCLLFYLDGRIKFERYCYGEAACGPAAWTPTAAFCGRRNRSLTPTRKPCPAA